MEQPTHSVNHDLQSFNTSTLLWTPGFNFRHARVTN